MHEALRRTSDCLHGEHTYLAKIRFENKITFYYGIIAEIMDRSEEMYITRRWAEYIVLHGEAILECVMEIAGDLTCQDLRTSLIELRGKTDL